MLLKKYLPNSYAEIEEVAKTKLSDQLFRSLLKASLFYCIRLKNENLPIGYINFLSPNSYPEFNDWTVNYWLGPHVRGHGIMELSLSCALSHMKKFKLQTLYAFVDNDNYKSINVLEKLGFGIHATQPMKLIYRIDLSSAFEMK